MMSLRKTSLFMALIGLMAGQAFGSGIIPVTKDKRGNYIYCLGYEKGGRDRHKYNDFGGTPDPGESRSQTAAREFHEETGGIFKKIANFRAGGRRWGLTINAQHLDRHCRYVGNRYRVYFVYLQKKFFSPNFIHGKQIRSNETDHGRWFTKRQLIAAAKAGKLGARAHGRLRDAAKARFFNLRPGDFPPVAAAKRSRSRGRARAASPRRRGRSVRGRGRGRARGRRRASSPRRRRSRSRKRGRGRGRGRSRRRRS